jgi:acyl-CoA synthetase (AMP-forming)/AMP-acid ligase II
MPTDAWTIPRLMARRREADAALPALVSEDGSIGWGALDAASRALAARLVRDGVAKGDRVGLLMPNGIDWVSAALAVMRVGAVLVPLSTLLRPPELLAQLRLAAVSQLIAVRSYRGRAYLDEIRSVAPALEARVRSGRRDATLPALRRLWTWGELPDAPAPARLVEALEDEVRPADDMVILFTSGSRGAPKGVIHTHGSALRATAASLEARTVRAGERLYVPMPFFWTGGFCTGLLSVLVAGATLLTEAAPEPERTLRFLERERATLFRGWPDQAARIAAHPAFASADLSSLRAGSLAAVLPPEKRPRPGARANIFGMTETAGPYCGARLDVDLPEAEHGSCGRPFAGVEVRIVDFESGTPVAPGAPGEIQLRGPNLMRGICGRIRSELFDAAGWYATGDLGTLDADGYLWYAGRRDDMFKVKGATVYPTEVEAGLRSIPGVAQAFVTDVAAEGAAKEVAALVVSKDADAARLADAARARLSAFKVPTLWLVVPSPEPVPTSATGKVDKPALQELLRSRGVRCGGAGGASTDQIRSPAASG